LRPHPDALAHGDPDRELQGEPDDERVGHAADAVKHEYELTAERFQSLIANRERRDLGEGRPSLWPVAAFTLRLCPTWNLTRTGRNSVTNPLASFTSGDTRDTFGARSSKGRLSGSTHTRLRRRARSSRCEAGRGSIRLRPYAR